MSYTFEEFAQQGWQCPICRRVYSPTTPMCYYCGNGETVTTTAFNVSSAQIDWLLHKSTTKDEGIKDESNN